MTLEPPRVLQSECPTRATSKDVTYMSDRMSVSLSVWGDTKCVIYMFLCLSVCMSVCMSVQLETQSGYITFIDVINSVVNNYINEDKHFACRILLKTDR